MNENNSPLQFFIFVVRSRHSRVLSADVTSLFGNRLDRPTRLGSVFATRLDLSTDRSTRSTESIDFGV